VILLDEVVQVVLRKNGVRQSTGSPHDALDHAREGASFRPSGQRERVRWHRPERVLVMQAAQYRSGEHERAYRQSMSESSELNSLRFSRRIRHARPQGAVRAAGVVMSRPLSQDQTQMRLGHRNHPVQALSPDGPNYALADRIRLRARVW
jgi:hypothetical protein